MASSDSTADSGSGADAKKKIPETIELPKQPFVIGAPTDYTKPGIYDTHLIATGVYVYVNDDNQLAVLSATCTHNFCIVHWQKAKDRFECPCHESLFDADGMPAVDGQEGKAALARLVVKVVDLENGKFIEVDPTDEYYEADWEAPGAFIDLGSL